MQRLSMRQRSGSLADPCFRRSLDIWSCASRLRVRPASKTKAKPANCSEPTNQTKRWPAMDHFTLKQGSLHCEDVPLEQIADEVGTPVYVYSASTLRRHARVLKEALARLDDPLVAYAVKANPNP